MSTKTIPSIKDARDQMDAFEGHLVSGGKRIEQCNCIDDGTFNLALVVVEKTGRGSKAAMQDTHRYTVNAIGKEPWALVERLDLKDGLNRQAVLPRHVGAESLADLGALCDEIDAAVAKAVPQKLGNAQDDGPDAAIKALSEMLGAPSETFDENGDLASEASALDESIDDDEDELDS